MNDKQKLEAVISLLGLNNQIVVAIPIKRKETRREIYNRLLNQVNESEALRLSKKNLC